MKIKVLCNVVDTGSAYGRRGDTIEVSEAQGHALCKGPKPRAVEVKEKASKPAATPKPAAS